MKNIISVHLGAIEETNGMLYFERNDLLKINDLLKKFDLDAIYISVIKYHRAILDLSNSILEFIQPYENFRVKPQSNSSSMQKLNFAPDENSILEERQKYLESRLDSGFDDVQSQIQNLKSQADQFFTKLNEVSHSTNSISELAELEQMSRPSFTFIVENFVNIANNFVSKSQFFLENGELISKIDATSKNWNENIVDFKTNSRNKFLANCNERGIDLEVVESWFSDWSALRFKIEKMFLPIVQYSLDGHLIAQFDSIFQALQNYKIAIDNFYLTERAGIYQKFAFQAGGELQEKFEVESQMMNLSEIFQSELQSVIFSCDSAEDRMFLLKWAESIINLPVEAVLVFVEERKLDKISAEILTRFSELRRQNFAQFISDAKAFSEDQKRREDEFNALMFKMRKELM